GRSLNRRPANRWRRTDHPAALARWLSRHPSSARRGITPSNHDHQTMDEVTPMPHIVPFKRATTFSVFIILAMSVLSPDAASAQVAGATLSGTISDASGAVIPGAMVSIRDTATGIIRTVGRNTLIGPGLVNFDFSAFKNNYISKISESFNVQFRTEFFNLFNRANFAPPPVIQAAPTNLEVINSAGSYVPLAGHILATQTPRQVFQ